MEKRQQLYRGKAKTVYATDDPALVIMHFRDDTSPNYNVLFSVFSRIGQQIVHSDAVPLLNLFRLERKRGAGRLRFRHHPINRSAELS